MARAGLWRRNGARAIPVRVSHIDLRVSETGLPTVPHRRTLKGREDYMTDLSRLSALLAAHAGQEGALLPILHEVQAEYGFIPDESLAPIATALRLTRAEVAGVVGFYHDFRKAPAGRHVIKLCRAEACQAMGGETVQARLEAALGMKLGETKGGVTLEAVYCLGLCACAPAAMVNDRLVGRLDVAAAGAIAAEVRA